MRKTRLCLAAALVLVLAASGAFAATTIWLTDNSSGATQPTQISVASGGTVTLYCFMTTDDPGNTFETMVGYDTSSKSAYGAGVIGDDQTGHFTLTSTKSDIVNSIDSSFFDVFTAAGYANSQVVLNASGRDPGVTTLPDLGGRAFGFVVRAAKTGGLLSVTAKKLFSFTLTNNLPGGQSGLVVVSNTTGTRSYSTAWKLGTALVDANRSLTINSTGQAKPNVGANNKAILDTIMTSAVAKFDFTFWGVVQPNPTGSSFQIDDGSGVVITVNVANSVIAGKYVSVKGGTVNVSTKTITGGTVTTYN